MGGVTSGAGPFRAGVLMAPAPLLCVKIRQGVFSWRRFQGLRGGRFFNIARMGVAFAWGMVFLVSANTLGQTIRINEVVSSNGGGLRDEDGASSDWIELHNPGAGAIDLEGYGLADQFDFEKAWRFGSLPLAGGGYVVVFASGKDRKLVPKLGPELDFARLEGMTLWLVGNDLSGESGEFVEEGRVVQWSSRGGLGIAVRRHQASGGPRVLRDHEIEATVLRFDGPAASLISTEVEGADLVGEDEGALFLVVRTVSPRHTGSPFFFESSGGHRLNVHLPWKDGVIYADFGKVEAHGRMSVAPPPGFLDRWHLVSVIRRATGTMELHIDGHLLAEAELAATMTPGWSGRLGIGAFDFRGEVAEILVLRRAIGAKLQNQIEGNLARRYRLSLQPLHTDFKIKSGGEPIILYDPSGKVVDSIPVTRGSMGRSFGRPEGSFRDIRHFEEPTPGAANQGEGYASAPESPLVVPESGWVDLPVVPRVERVPFNATLRYTLDGREPTERSPVLPADFGLDRSSLPNSRLALIPTNPVRHQNVGGELSMPLDRREAFGWRRPAVLPARAVTLRVRAFVPGALPGKTATRTYFPVEEDRSPHSLPVVALTFPPGDWFDSESGLYLPGNRYDPADWAHAYWGSGNYFLRGRSSERVVEVERFTGLSFQGGASIGMRIQGGGSRAQPMKSLRLVARDSLGPLDWDEGGGPSFRSIQLRNAGQDSVWRPSLIRDWVIQRCAPDSAGVNQQQPVVVYFNGEYWGVHFLQMVATQSNVQSRFGLEGAAIDLIEVDGKARSGSGGAYYELIHLAETGRDAEFLELLNRIDVGSFIDHYATQIYFGNQDWPANNHTMWRVQTDPLPQTPLGVEDGRWRWLTQGTEDGLGLSRKVEEDAVARLLEPGRGDGAVDRRSTALFRYLTRSAPFRFHFLSRMSMLMNGPFRADRVNAIVSESVAAIESEMGGHSKRWRRPISEAAWRDEIERIRVYAKEREAHVRRHLVEAFALRGSHQLSFHVQPPDGGELRMAGLTQGQRPHSWEALPGRYFAGIPLSIEAVAKPGYRFHHWSGSKMSISPKIFVSPLSDQELVAHFIQTVRFTNLRFRGQRLGLVADLFVGGKVAAAQIVIEGSPDLLQWHPINGVRLLPVEIARRESRYVVEFPPRFESDPQMFFRVSVGSHPIASR